MVFGVQKLFSLMQSSLLILTFVAVLLVPYLKNDCQDQYQRSFFSEFLRIHVLHLRLDFRLIFEYGVRKIVCFIILIVGILFPQDQVLKRLYHLCCVFFVHL